MLLIVHLMHPQRSQEEWLNKRSDCTGYAADQLILAQICVAGKLAQSV